MRPLSQEELLNLNKLLQAETSAISKARMMVSAIDDEKLKKMTETAIISCEARIRGIQQFINENAIISSTEVH